MHVAACTCARLCVYIYHTYLEWPCILHFEVFFNHVTYLVWMITEGPPFLWTIRRQRPHYKIPHAWMINNLKRISREAGVEVKPGRELAWDAERRTKHCSVAAHFKIDARILYFLVQTQAHAQQHLLAVLTVKHRRDQVWRFHMITGIFRWISTQLPTPAPQFTVQNACKLTNMDIFLGPIPVSPPQAVSPGPSQT